MIHLQKRLYLPTVLYFAPSLHCTAWKREDCTHTLQKHNVAQKSSLHNWTRFSPTLPSWATQAHGWMWRAPRCPPSHHCTSWATQAVPRCPPSHCPTSRDIHPVLLTAPISLEAGAESEDRSHNSAAVHTQYTSTRYIHNTYTIHINSVSF